MYRGRNNSFHPPYHFSLFYPSSHHLFLPFLTIPSLSSFAPPPLPPASLYSLHALPLFTPLKIPPCRLLELLRIQDPPFGGRSRNLCTELTVRLTYVTLPYEGRCLIWGRKVRILYSWPFFYYSLVYFCYCYYYSLFF